MNRERITISLLTEDSDILEHLHTIKSERTISSYLRHLIRQDMLGNPSTNNLDQLAEILANILLKEPLMLSYQQEKPTEIVVDLEDISIINGLF
ncbi:hypothetical protein PGC35_14340 [Psychrobacillus sp. PGGUH221]|uniref:hypothetical protein n=1 Tax=Psychrobacillus sp. PGGUH221 TaxID=3020058 RepID=UPI0035C7685C